MLALNSDLLASGPRVLGLKMRASTTQWRHNPYEIFLNIHILKTFPPIMLTKGDFDRHHVEGSFLPSSKILVVSSVLQNSLLPHLYPITIYLPVHLLSLQFDELKQVLCRWGLIKAIVLRL